MVEITETDHMVLGASKDARYPSRVLLMAIQSVTATWENSFTVLFLFSDAGFEPRVCAC